MQPLSPSRDRRLRLIFPGFPGEVLSRSDHRRVLWALLLAATAGCGAPDRSKLTDEVLKADPGFRNVLDQRNEYASQSSTTEREFALKRDTVQRTIDTLREELQESRKTLQKKQAHFRELLEPERRKLHFDLSMAVEELRAKRVQRASIGRSIARLRKTLKQADATWSEQERRQQDAQLQDMVEDARRLDGELATLKQHTDLLKHKLVLLQL